MIKKIKKIIKYILGYRYKINNWEIIDLSMRSCPSDRSAIVKVANRDT